MRYKIIRGTKVRIMEVLGKNNWWSSWELTKLKAMFFILTGEEDLWGA